MSVTLAIDAVDQSRRKQEVSYAITPNGNYAAGGDALDMTAATDPKALGVGWGTEVPELSLSHSIADKYGLELAQGSTLANAKLKVLDLATNVELVAGAYPANLTAALADVRLLAKGNRY
jgi:hypothetical protein